MGKHSIDGAPINITDKSASDWEFNILAKALASINTEWSSAFDTFNMKAGETLVHAGIRTNTIFFPFEGLISLLVETDPDDRDRRDAINSDEGGAVQVAMLGHQDLIGVHALLGGSSGKSTYKAVVDSGGRGLRVGVGVAQRILAKDDRSRALLGKYMDLLLTESYHAIACAAKFTVDQRLSAWLLRTGETINSLALPFPHHYVGRMLGVRRATISLELKELERHGLIRTERGRINLENPEGLRQKAGRCWELARVHRQTFLAELAEYIGPDADTEEAKA